MQNIRFLKQTKLSNCGPVAILNAIKYFGIPTSKDDLKYIEFLAKTNKDGSSDKDLLKALKSIKLWKVKEKVASLKSLCGLSSGKIYILGYNVIEKNRNKEFISGHFVLLVKKTNTFYYAVNHINNKDFNKVNKTTKSIYIKTMARISASTIKDLMKPLKYKGERIKSVLWELSL